MLQATKTLVTAVTAVTPSLSSTLLLAEKDPDVGGASMSPNKNTVRNEVNSKDHPAW